MNIGVYAIKDTKAGVFNNPFFTRHEAEAIRGFNRAANDPNTTISIYPADFELYKLGEWSDFTGCHTDLGTPSFVMNGITARDLNKTIVDTSERIL
ncbi:MAG: nonstructural protein [Arizlama microvirus]|nr:MAG: nonstructural protein [Arizlama microvirus]